MIMLIGGLLVGKLNFELLLCLLINNLLGLIEYL